LERTRFSKSKRRTCLISSLSALVTSWCCLTTLLPLRRGRSGHRARAQCNLRASSLHRQAVCLRCARLNSSAVTATSYIVPHPPLVSFTCARAIALYPTEVHARARTRHALGSCCLQLTFTCCTPPRLPRSLSSSCASGEALLRQRWLVRTGNCKAQRRNACVPRSMAGCGWPSPGCSRSAVQQAQ